MCRELIDYITVAERTRQENDRLYLLQVYCIEKEFDKIRLIRHRS